MLWEISGTTSADGEITYHGKTLHELTSLLPKWPGSQQLSPEAMLWYLYTASIPTPAQLQAFTADLVRRAERIPDDVMGVCDSLPSALPVSAQLVACLSAYAPHSKFNAALEKGAPKQDLWKYALEDTLDESSVVPIFCARIHANKYRSGQGRDIPLDHNGDLAQNFARLMGHDDSVFADLVRLCWAAHMDHGASISSHTMRKIISSLMMVATSWLNVCFDHLRA